MRRISKLSVLCLAAGVMTACALPDEVVTTENIPTAGVRFVNATPDTMAVDFRFIDRVESNAHFRIGFRAAPVTASGVPASTQVQYKNARAGLRHFSVFLDDTLQSVASIALLNDSTFTFEAGKNYTVMMWGQARLGRFPAVAGGLRFSIWEEAVADPAANVAMRLINATGTAIDGYQYLSTGAVGTADWAALAGYTVGVYVNVVPTTGTATRRFQIRNAAGTNSIVSCPDASALKGAIASADIEPLPGTDVAGTAVTGIVFPGSTAGSKAVQFSTTTGSVNQLATATGYEAARSYISDGFCPGMTVTAAGFAAANNGNVVIAAVTDGATTGSIPGAGSATYPAGSAATNFLTATATGYARSAGSFLTNGFAVGQNVTIAGFTKAGTAAGFGAAAGSNNGTAVITAVTALTMDVTKTNGTVVEAGSTGSISMGVVAGALGTTGGTYTRTAGSFTTDGFFVGQAITATGFAAAVGATPTNNGASTVVSISPDGLNMTVSKATGMANETAAAARTLSVSTGRSIVGFGRMDITGGRTVEAAGGSKTLTVSPLPPGITFVWDRRPPRTACSPLC